MMVLDALGNIAARSDSEIIGGIENLGDRTLGGGCDTISQDLMLLILGLSAQNFAHR
jgi:hypothetical protein